MIINDAITYLKRRYPDKIGKLKISDLRSGVFLTALSLSDGSTGVSGTLTPSKTEVHSKKEERDFGEFTPNQIIGRNVKDLLECEKRNSLIVSLKVAAINAISSKLTEQQGYTILPGTDPIDRVDLSGGKTITLVGAFSSYINRIAATNNRLFVLEFNEEVLEKKFRKHYVPAERYPAILPASDVVIITGFTLVNNSFDDLLKNTRPGSQVIITGPSSGFIPEVLFGKGVDIIGSVRIPDPSIALKIAGEGGTGYHLFRYGAEKICILNEKI